MTLFWVKFGFLKMLINWLYLWSLRVRNNSILNLCMQTFACRWGKTWVGEECGPLVSYSSSWRGENGFILSPKDLSDNITNIIAISNSPCNSTQFHKTLHWRHVVGTRFYCISQITYQSNTGEPAQWNTIMNTDQTKTLQILSNVCLNCASKVQIVRHRILNFPPKGQTNQRIQGKCCADYLDSYIFKT